MQNEGIPRGKDELIAEEARLVDMLRLKDEQTAANVAAGVIAEGALDEDRVAFLAELDDVRAELSAIRAREADERIEAARQAPLEGM